jgi:membrane protein DedA with SNARE-associated domain
MRAWSGWLSCRDGRVAPLVVALLHHHLQGSTLDYLGVAAAAAVSWIGIPGPGEPVLIAAALLARHHLDITTVVISAWLAATVGGIIGWLIGLKAGRAVLVAPGPLYSLRVGAVARGERVFERHPVLAILLTPAWVAGIHRVPGAIYQPINVISAAIWAAGIGFGVYLIGPAVERFVDDFGLVTTTIVAVVILAGVAFEIRHQRRRRRHRQAAAVTAGAPAAKDPCEPS